MSNIPSTSVPSTSQCSPGKSGSPGKSNMHIAEPNKEMNTYRTSEGGFKIPTMGLGTMFTESEDIENAIENALTLGYRHIDTAFMYNTEEPIGKILDEWIRTDRLTREEIFVTSKLPFHGTHSEAVEFFLKKSLENLKLEYLDLYLIHFPVAFSFNHDEVFVPEPAETDIEAVWKSMEKQVDAGRTKYIGLANFNVKQIDRIMKIARINPACLQIEMHVLLQQHELVEYCRNNNIIIVAYAPLGAPHLIKFKNLMPHPIIIPDLQNNKLVAKVAEKHQKTPAQILIRFLIEKGVCVIPKSAHANRLKENFLALTFKLDINDMAALALLDEDDKGRIVNLGHIYPQIADHPEYPFNL